MKKWLLESRWITGGLSLVLLLMSLVSYVSYQNAVRLVASANKVRHTNQILNTLTDVVATLTDAESGRRGYILFGDPEELERYNFAVRAIEPKINQLQALLADDPTQQQRLAKLDILITQRLALYQRTTEFYRSGDSSSNQVVIAEETKQNKREIRQIVDEIRTKEQQILQLQLSQSQAGFQIRMLIEFFGTFLTFIVLLGVYGLLYRQMVKRQQAEASQRALAQAKELSDLKLNFFSMVSHEFRTPLSIILGSAQLLEEGKQWIDPKKQNNLHRIQSSARLMTKLLTDILTLARAEAGRLDCNPTLIDLEAFCLNLIEDIQFSDASAHRIRLTNQGLTHAYLDENMIYTILTNLLSNAVKYSQAGEIGFTIRSESDGITFEITDQGIGIPAADLQTLYEPFHRSRNVGKVVGTGLGLAVVKQCVDLLDGQITVKSQEHVGTTFTVYIPQMIPQT